MPATTPVGLPYPVGADPIDIANDIKKLAEAVDPILKRLSGVAAMGQTTSTAAVQFFGGGSLAQIGVAPAPTPGRYLAIVEAYCFTSVAAISTAALDIFCTELGVHAPPAGLSVPVALNNNIGIPVIMMGYFDIVTPATYTFSVSGVLTSGTSFWVGHRTLSTLRVQPYNQA